MEKKNIVNRVGAYPQAHSKYYFISIILLPMLRLFSKVLKADEDIIDGMLCFDSLLISLNQYKRGLLHNYDSALLAGYFILGNS